MKFHIRCDDDDFFQKELDSEGNVELPDDLTAFLQKVSSWGRFAIYAPGTKIYFDTPSHPTLWTLYFQNGYD